MYFLEEKTQQKYTPNHHLSTLYIFRKKGKGVFGGNEKGLSESTKLLLNMINRIFETNLSTSSPTGLMSYADFVFFVKSEVIFSYRIFGIIVYWMVAS